MSNPTTIFLIRLRTISKKIKIGSQMRDPLGSSMYYVILIWSFYFFFKVSFFAFQIIDVIAIPSVMASSSKSTTVWEDNSPETLFIIASKCILANPGVLFR